MRTRALFVLVCLAAATTLLVASCGGDDEPSGGPSGGPVTGTGVSQATITIGLGGVVSPAAVTIEAGNRVTIVNNDSAPHNMNSDPHPIHNDCPALNVGVLTTGQSRDSGVLNTRRTCGFHDHDNPDNASLRGSVTVQ